MSTIFGLKMYTLVIELNLQLQNILLKVCLALARWLTQFIRASSHTPNGFQLDSQSGLIPRLWGFIPGWVYMEGS